MDKVGELQFCGFVSDTCISTAKMAFLVSSHDECLEDVYSVLKQAELRAIVKDYTGTITSYKKVKNGFLEAMYKLKKQEYISKYGISGVKEMKLIHSTAVNNVFGIIKDNFDWRRVIRNKYGNGVSFSDDADYANCHSNRSNGSERAFIIANVLRAKETFGFPGLRIPSMECDTTIGNHVYVKYRDNEFLPKYVLYYKCDSVCNSKYYRKRRGLLFW